MKEIPIRLWDTIAAIASMKHPSLAQILRRRGFGYEADRVDDLTIAFEEVKKSKEEKKDVG